MVAILRDVEGVFRAWGAVAARVVLVTAEESSSNGSRRACCSNFSFNNVEEKEDRGSAEHEHGGFPASLKHF